MGQTVMSQQDIEEQAQYNAVAQKYSEKLVEFRVAQKRELDSEEQPIESLFPPFNRAGFGVNYEYNRSFCSLYGSSLGEVLSEI